MNVAELATRVAEPLRTPPRPAGRHLRVVDEAARRRTRRLRVAARVFGVVTAVAVLAAVAFHVALAQSEFELDRVAKATAVARLDYERARLAAAEARSPERIMAGAEGLGMVAPADLRVVSVSEGASGIGRKPVGPDGETSGPADDWRRVKPHLGAQP